MKNIGDNGRVLEYTELFSLFRSEKYEGLHLAPFSLLLFKAVSPQSCVI